MTKEKMAVVDPKTLEWERVEHPKAPKGMWGKLLSLEEETGAMTVLVKLEKGFHEPKHTHPSDAQVMVMEGKLIDGKVGEIKKGMYWFIPAGCGTRSRRCTRRLCSLHTLQWSCMVAEKTSQNAWYSFVPQSEIHNESK